jgi:hypothetical protein
MARPNNIEGGFGGYNRIDIESQQYETISKSSLNSSKEEYVDSIMQAAGLRGTKHKKRLQRYYDENNDQLINPQQNSLSQSRFRTVVEGISNQQKSNAGISGEYNDYTKVSSGDQVLDKIIDKNIRNSINPEGEKNVQIDELDDVINTEQSTLSPEQQARIYEYQYPTRKANENDYFRGYTLPEWLHIEVDSEEHNKLKEAIKELGVMPKLGELDTIIKAQHQSNEISGNYLSFINATRELYGLNPLQTTSEIEELQDSLPDNSGVESTPVEGEAQSQYYIVEGSRFNLARYNGDDEIRLAMIKDDLSELGISGIELDELISSRGLPDIPSKSVKIGDKTVDWDDEDPESRLSYRESAIAEYYGIDTNKGMFTDETQATEDENIRKKITYGNMNNEAWKNLNTGETSQTFGHLPDPNTEEEPTIEGRATRRRSSAQEGDISSTDEIQPTTTEPEALANVTDIESPKATKEDFGSMPEDPYNIRGKDRQALITLFESHPEVFPEGNYVDVSTWNDWTPLAIGEEKKEGSNKFYVYIENGDKQSTDFGTIEDAEKELTRMKTPDKQKALDLVRKARNFAIGEDLETPWADVVDISSTDSEPITTEPEASTPENSGLKHSTEASSDAVAGRVVQDKALNVEPLPEIAVDGVEDDNVTGGEPEVNQGTSQPTPESKVTDQTNPDLDELQSELSRLVAEAAIELSKEQGGAIVRASDEASKTFEPNLDILYQQLNSNIINPSESGKLARVEGDIYPGEVELETVHNSIEINSVKEKVLEAISDYQKFININRNNLRDEKIYNEYRIIEKKAWFHVGRFIHKLGGEIATLPQERDIQLAHPEVVDIKEYLVNEEKITLDEEDNITHLNIDGNIIELNRPRTIEELLKAKRPTHILYHSGTPISEDDPTKQNYRGLLIDGLNEDTLELIEGVLNKKETVIVDETKRVSEELPEQTPDEVVEEKPQPTIGKEPPIMPIFQVEDGVSPTFNTQGKYSLEDKFKQEPWFEDSKGETAFNKIFADSLKNKDEISENVGTPDPWLERTEKPEVETAAIPQTHPDFGSVYYQESQRWNYLQSLEEQYRENPKDENIKAELEQARQTYQDFVDRINDDPNQDKFRDFLALRQSYANEEASNTMDRFRKAIGLSQHNETELALSRERYNAALQELLKTEVSDKVSLNIKQLFADEFSRLRDERAQQTRELQGPETRIDRLKNKFFKFATKHKSRISGVNLLLLGGSLFAAGTGIGIPVAGAMDVSRRFIGGVMSGVTGRETIRSTFEDANLDLKIPRTNFSIFKYKGSITNLVEKSLKDDYINKASDTELLKIISTLDAYYGLNGGRFTEASQKEAYEKATYALGKKVENSLQPNSETLDTIDANSTSFEDEVPLESNSNTQDISQSSDYMNELLTRGSIDRVRELNKQKNIRLGANTAGFLIGGTLLGSLAADMHRPGGVFNPNNNPDTGASVPKTEPGSSTGGTTTGESVTPKPIPGPVSPNPSEAPSTGGLGDYPPAPELPTPEEVLRMRENSEQLAQSAEATRAAAEQAARQASEQLAQDVSNLTPRESIWTEVSKQLKGATDTQIQQAVENLLQSAEGQNSIYKLAQGTEGGRALLSQWGIDNASEMAILSKEQLYEISRYLAPGELQGITEFTRGLSKALGTTNLTEIQVGNILEAYIENPQNKESLYYLILDNQQNNQALTNLLIDYGVSDIDKFVELSPDRMYKLAELVGVENLDKLPGFELNEIILSQFENAPDSLNLVQGSKPLNLMDNYISKYAENLPGSRSLGKLVLEKYILETDEGRAWLYDAIENNRDKTSAGAENLQKVRELFSRDSIKSPEDLKRLLIDSKGYPSAQVFWDRLSWVLKPGEMPGIKKALGLVLTK